MCRIMRRLAPKEELVDQSHVLQKSAAALPSSCFMNRIEQLYLRSLTLIWKESKAVEI